MARLRETQLLTLLCFFSACTLAQYNVIYYPPGGYDIIAGEPYTITWTNPSSGTVTINLYKSQQDLSDPLVLANDVPASDEAATIAISPSSIDSSFEYEFEIVDNTDTHNIAFSSHSFVVKIAPSGSSSTSTTSALPAPNAPSTVSSLSTSSNSISSSSRSTRSTSSTTTTRASSSSSPIASFSSSQSTSPSSSTRTAARTTNASASQTAVASQGSDSSSKGLSTGAKAGIGVGAALVVVALLVLAYWFGRRHNKKSTGHTASASRHGEELDAEGNARHEIHGKNTGHELEGEKSGGTIFRYRDDHGMRPSITERAELEAVNRQWSELDGRTRQKT